jgi:hypothetical protein
MEEVHPIERKRPNVTQRKPPGRATIPTEERLFVGRSEAAQMLSISCRALDYLIGKKQLNTRRIGSRVLIPRPTSCNFAGATILRAWSGETSAPPNAPLEQKAIRPASLFAGRISFASQLISSLSGCPVGSLVTYSL